MTGSWRTTLVAWLVVLVVVSTSVGAALPGRTDAGVAPDGHAGPDVSARVPDPVPSDSTASSSDATTAADAPSIHARFTVSNHSDPGAVTVRVTFDPPGNVRSLGVRPAAQVADRVEVVDARGFSAAEDGDGWTWEPDPPKPIDPSLTMRYAVNDTEEVFDGLNFADTRRWALFARPNLAVRWSYTGTPPTYEPTMTVAENATGYAASTMGYLGAYETHEATRNGQRFTLVVPATADPTTPEAVFDTLGNASRLLDVGGADDRVVVFRGPDPLRTGGLARPDDSDGNGSTPDAVWVHEDAEPNDPTYVSEYVHTRQAFEETDRMSWITEAQDVYFSSLVALYRGTYSYERFRHRVATDESTDAVLAPPDRSVDRRRADYEKGARVLAALDAEIRRATDRNRSVEDVWRRMNAHEGPLNYTDFRAIVADVANRSLDDWLDRYLTTAAAPAVPDNRTLYAPIESGLDSDGDGLVTRAELDAGTDPFDADTDGDGVSDGEELERETDPLRTNADDGSEDYTSDGGDTTTGTTSEDAETTTTSGTEAPEETTSEDEDRDTTQAHDAADSRDGSDSDVGSDDDSVDGIGEAAVVLGLVGVTLAASLLAALTLLARVLDWLVGVAPGVLVRRSVRRLVALAAVAAALLVAYVTQFA